MLKINGRLSPVFLVAILALPSIAQASFQDQGWGVRALGMGRSFVAVADDGSAPYWNPAGSAYLKRGEANFVWDRSYPELEGITTASGFTSVLFPSRWGSFGAAVTHFKLSGILRENVGLVNYAYALNSKIAVGFNLKYLNHDFEIGNDPAYASSPVFANGTQKSAFSLDGGFLIRPFQRLSFGLSGKNLTEPDVGLVSKDKVLSEYQVGAAWRAGNRFTLAADGYYRNQDYGRKTRYSVGAEWLPLGARNFSPALRTGYNTDEVSGGISFFSWAKSKISFRVDYAFIYNLNMRDGSGSHKIGLAFLFLNRDPS